MRTILVLAGGRESDKAVFSTALSAARPLGAHVEFLHVRIAAGEAAIYTPHVGFAHGTALAAAIGKLTEQSKLRSRAALHHFEELCEKEPIEIAIRPADRKSGSIPACWREECDDAVSRMIHCARHNDLVAIGRPNQSNGLPPDIIERLLTASGRPLLIAPKEPRPHIAGSILVCWKETAESARALAAAMPLLVLAKRVTVVSVGEEASELPEHLFHLVDRLEWNGIKAEPVWMPNNPKSAAYRLEELATSLDVDLIVMGGYGHGRMREIVLGGCTRHFLNGADRPLLMMH